MHRKFFARRSAPLAARRRLDAPVGVSGEGRLIDLLIASLTSPSMAVARDERHLRLLEALAALPQESQTALRFRYVENLPSKEIANGWARPTGRCACC